jgi:hypothetical protein
MSDFMMKQFRDARIRTNLSREWSVWAEVRMARVGHAKRVLKVRNFVLFDIFLLHKMFIVRFLCIFSA